MWYIHDSKPTSRTHPLFVDERVDLCDGDDLRHEAAQPLWVEEEQPAQFALHVSIVQQNPTLVEETDCLCNECSEFKCTALQDAYEHVQSTVHKALKALQDT